jgi:hypothetical protein
MKKKDVADKPDPAPYGIDPDYYAQNVPSPLVAAVNLNNSDLINKLLDLGANPHGMLNKTNKNKTKCNEMTK